MKSFANISMLKTCTQICDKSSCGWDDPGLYTWVDAWILAIEVIGTYKKEVLRLKEYGLYLNKTEAEDAVLEYALKLQKIGFAVEILNNLEHPGRDLRTKVETVGKGRFWGRIIPRSFELKPVKGGD